jgi:adenine-specific DNA methylase
MLQWGDLFTARQKVALTLMAEKARALTKNSKVNMTIMELEGLIINRVADYYSSSCAWHVPKQLIANTFRRNALPIEALAKVPCWMIYLNK